MAFYTLSKGQIRKLVKEHPALFTEVIPGDGNLPSTSVTTIPEFAAIDVPHNPIEDLIAVFEINKNGELVKWLGDITIQAAWRL